MGDCSSAMLGSTINVSFNGATGSLEPYGPSLHLLSTDKSVSRSASGSKSHYWMLSASMNDGESCHLCEFYSNAQANYAKGLFGLSNCEFLGEGAPAVPVPIEKAHTLLWECGQKVLSSSPAFPLALIA